MGRPAGADAAGRLREALNALLGAAEFGVTPVALIADEVPRQRAALRSTEHRPWPLPETSWLMASPVGSSEGPLVAVLLLPHPLPNLRMLLQIDPVQLLELRLVGRIPTLRARRQPRVDAHPEPARTPV
jgi:hypothetical protein